MHAQLDALHVPGLHALLAQLHAGVDAGVDHDAAGKRLVGVERDLEAAAQFVGNLVPVGLGRDHLHEAARRLQRLRARGIAVPRHQRRHQPGARRAARVERLGHGAELLAQAHRLGSGDAQRHRRAVLVQPKQARAGRRRTQHAGGTGDVPATVVVVRIHGVAHAAGHVDAQHHGIGHGAAAGAGVLGQRQHGGGHRAGRVDDGLQVRIVEIERMRGNAIHQRGAGHVHLVPAAQHRGLRRRLEFRHSGQRGHGGLMPGRAHGAAQPVHEGAMGFVVHLAAPALRRMRGHELAEDARDRRGVVIGGDMGIACHGIGVLVQ
ncbi:hypothetical protein D3C81_1276740 [compost metagenome]